MVVDLSRYDGDAFEAALDVFYGVMDDLKMQAADGRLTLIDLEEYRSRIVRETYSKFAEMKKSGGELRNNPEQLRRRPRLQEQKRQQRDKGQPSSSRSRPVFPVIHHLVERWRRR